MLLDYLDKFYYAYINNILIYSNFLEKYRDYIQKILKRLRKVNLYANINKYKFYITSTKFFSFIINIKGVAVDPAKVAIVKD